jgi:hypothetical protein
LAFKPSKAKRTFHWIKGSCPLLLLSFFPLTFSLMMSGTNSMGIYNANIALTLQDDFHGDREGVVAEQ